jgi:hypothetical protein
LTRARNGRLVAVAAAILAAIVIPAQAMATAAADDKSVAAEVAGQKITMQEMDDFLRKTNAKAFQEFYDARRAALEGLSAETLIAAEAAAKGITADKLKEQLASSAPAVTDADIQKFYDENKGRVGGRTLDQVKDQIKNYLATTGQQKVMADFLSAQKAKSNVRILLAPPRADVKIAENDPKKGPANAPVRIVEFSDFQ